MMLRSLYVWLLQLHPAAFRQRFGEEMLEIFENAAGLRASVLLLVDGLMSLMRQWALRPEFRQPFLATAVSEGAADVPHFRTIDSYKPRPAAMFHGGLLTVVMLCAVVGVMGKGGKVRVFLIGVHHPSSHLLPVNSASVAESELNTTVKFGPVPEDPWHAIAAAYFKVVRVLDALDADQDLIISPWEIITAPGAPGADKPDGKLVRKRRFLPIQMPPGPRRARLDRADIDHDGEISATEIANSSAALKKLDRNGDGSLTPDELIPDQEAVQAATIMIRLDTNGDGVISRAERESEEAEPLQDLLQSADRNHDGLTTQEELARELRLRGERLKASDNARRAAGFR